MGTRPRRSPKTSSNASLPSLPEHNNSVIHRHQRDNSLLDPLCQSYSSLAQGFRKAQAIQESLFKICARFDTFFKSATLLKECCHLSEFCEYLTAFAITFLLFCLNTSLS